MSITKDQIIEAVASMSVMEVVELIEAYAPYMNMSLWRAEDGWICLVGQAV